MNELNVEEIRQIIRQASDVIQEQQDKIEKLEARIARQQKALHLLNHLDTFLAHERKEILRELYEG